MTHCCSVLQCRPGLFGHYMTLTFDRLRTPRQLWPTGCLLHCVMSQQFTWSTSCKPRSHTRPRVPEDGRGCVSANGRGCGALPTPTQQLIHVKDVSRACWRHPSPTPSSCTGCQHPNVNLGIHSLGPAGMGRAQADRHTDAEVRGAGGGMGGRGTEWPGACRHGQGRG